MTEKICKGECAGISQAEVREIWESLTMAKANLEDWHPNGLTEYYSRTNIKSALEHCLKILKYQDGRA